MRENYAVSSGLTVAQAQSLTGTPVSPGMPANISQVQDPSRPVESFAEALPAIGAVGGSMIGAGSPVPGGAAIGGGLGYTGMKNLKRAILGQPANIQTVIQDVTEGATQELGGAALGKVAGLAGKALGSTGKQLLGKTTGAGPGAIEEAVKGGKAFTEAMRGKIPKEQVVGDAIDALRQVKDVRFSEYRTELAKIAKDKQNIDISPIRQKLSQLLKQYNIKSTEDGLDFSRSTIDRTARGPPRKLWKTS